MIDDPFGMVGDPRDKRVILLKEIRDRVTCNEREKMMLFDTGFVNDIAFDGTIEEVSVIMEILALMANSRDQGIRNEIRSNISKIFDLVKELESPFSSADVSIFRSFRIIISRVDQDSFYDRYFMFFLSIIEMNGQSLCLNAIKNEVIEIFHPMIVIDRRMEKDLSNKRIIRILTNHEFNAMKLLNMLVNEDTKRYIKIGRLFKRVERSNVRNKIEGLSCCVKLYKMSHSRDVMMMEKMIYALDGLISHQGDALILVGLICEDDIGAQLFCREIGLVSKIIDLSKENKPEELKPELLFCLYSLTTKLEENRKAVARTQIIPIVFGLFKLKVSRREVDYIFVMMIWVLKSMTKSVTFLRSDLLDYPIVELLMSMLDESNPDEIDGMEEIFKDRMVPGFVNESILQVLVNLVMEYGDYKNKFIASRGIEKIIRYTSRFPHVVLQLFKNFLYDTSFNSKEMFIRMTHRHFFKEFFDMYEDCGDMEILEGCFNLMRNLLCDDTLDYIVQSYEDMITSIFFHLDRFASGGDILENSKEEGVLLQILYTIVNLSANSDKFKSMVLDTKHLSDMMKVSATRNLRIAFIWIIINLSWREEGFETRVEILRSNGVKEWLIRLQAKDSVLADKIGTALENLRL